MLPSWNFSSLATENESRLCLNWVGLFRTWVELLYCLLLLLSHFSCVQLYGTPRTVAHQAPLSMGFSRQEHWSGLLFSSPGDSSPPRIGNCVSCIGRQLLYQWATPWETDKLDITGHLMLLGKSICLCQWFRASLVPSEQLLEDAWGCPLEAAVDRCGWGDQGLSAALLSSPGCSSTSGCFSLGHSSLICKVKWLEESAWGHFYFDNPLSVWIGLDSVHPAQYEVWLKTGHQLKGDHWFKRKGLALCESYFPWGR